MNYAREWLTLLLFALLAAGCAKNPDALVVAVPAPPRATTAVAPIDMTEDPIVGVEPADELERNFDRVFFAFDSAQLTAEAVDLLERNAEILMSYPEVSIRIQGHADERGSNAYNYALGMRRARSVQDALLRMGVEPAQIETVSFGETDPIAMRDGEIPWAKNRRAEFEVLTDPNQVVQGTLGTPVEMDHIVTQRGMDPAMYAGGVADRTASAE